MKIWRSEYIFNHPWETVSEAVWRKYPNPHKPEIIGTDIVEREVNSGVLLSQRLITSRFGLPAWSRKILGTEDICYGFETSEVDPKNQIMSCSTKNLTFDRTVTMLERMVYKAAPPAPNSTEPRTMLEHEFTVIVHGIPLSSYLEDTILGSLARNAFKGREALEWTIARIKSGWSAQLLAATDDTSASSSKTFSLSVDGVSDNVKKSMDELSELALKSVDELGGKALKSVDEFSGKALKSVDEFSGKALKSVDEFSGKALKSVDEFSGKALKSVDEFSGKALKSVDELSGKALKSVDELSDKALKSVDELSGKAFKSVRQDRHFDELFNLFL